MYVFWVTIRALPCMTTNCSSTKKTNSKLPINTISSAHSFSLQRRWYWNSTGPSTGTIYRNGSHSVVSSGLQASAAGYVAEIAMQAKETFPGKQIWSCLPSPANVKYVSQKTEVFCVVGKGERKAAPFVLSRDIYFTSLSHVNETNVATSHYLGLTTSPNCNSWGLRHHPVLAGGGEGSFPWGFWAVIFAGTIVMGPRSCSAEAGEQKHLQLHGAKAPYVPNCHVCYPFCWDGRRQSAQGSWPICLTLGCKLGKTRSGSTGTGEKEGTFIMMDFSSSLP